MAKVAVLRARQEVGGKKDSWVIERLEAGGWEGSIGGLSREDVEKQVVRLRKVGVEMKVEEGRGQ